MAGCASSGPIGPRLILTAPLALAATLFVFVALVRAQQADPKTLIGKVVTLKSEPGLRTTLEYLKEFRAARPNRDASGLALVLSEKCLPAGMLPAKLRARVLAYSRDYYAFEVRLFLTGGDSRVLWVSIEDVADKSLEVASKGEAANVGRVGELVNGLPVCRSLDGLNQVAVAIMNHDVDQVRSLLDEGECVGGTPHTQVKILANSNEAMSYKVLMSLPEGDTQIMWVSWASVSFPEPARQTKVPKP